MFVIFVLNMYHIPRLLKLVHYNFELVSHYLPLLLTALCQQLLILVTAG